LWIIFDLDDTLIDTFGGIIPFQLENALQAMVKSGLKISSFKSALSRLIEINNTAGNGREALSKFLQEVKAPRHFLGIGVKEYYYQIKEQSYSVKPLPDAISVLTQLKDKNQLFLITCGVKDQQFKKMIKAGIKPEWFKEIIVTRNFEDKNYLSWLKKNNFPPNKVLVCSDNFKSDLFLAKQLGMKTLQVKWGRGKINSAPLSEVDFSINYLTEIIPIVERLN